MPAKDMQWWLARKDLPHPCHYLDTWEDWYAWVVRTRALRRVWPRDVRSVLDVGCGDGRYGQWMQRQFGVSVTGVDVLRYPGVADRISCFRFGDAEHLRATFGPCPGFELATAITSLSFVNQPARAISQLAGMHCRYCLVLDNTQTPTPPWQQGLSYKQPLELPWVRKTFASQGYSLERAVVVNVLDRRLMVAVPSWAKPLAVLATLAFDLPMSYIVPLERARYTALLFVRG